ncbi:unnamed protein product [Malus baccata var. baccata]
MKIYVYMKGLMPCATTTKQPIDAEKFYKLLKEAKQPLYDGCKSYSNLSFVVNLLHIKSTGTMSNKAFGALLKLLKDAFPFCEKLPTSNDGAKKIVAELGLHYEKIDACKNDCIIYYKEHANATQCPTCKLSRWRTQKKGNKKKGKKVPWKILRYFPLTPRLQRLYMSSKTAAYMRWHSKDRVKDGVLRHPADSEQWKSFDQIHESFGIEPRNVRLSLAIDGFNPFGKMNLRHSTWPVLIFPYNLPPWMCMKEPYTFMSLLILGPTSPGNDIDVYLSPLIDELQTLWETGVETYDISTRQNFQMRAALMWTINDYPAYAYMSGWSTQGRLACPYCASKTSHCRLSHGSKMCYLGHRRFLPSNHSWRKQKNKFDNTREKTVAPSRPSGDDVIQELDELRKITHGKQNKQTIPGYLHKLKSYVRNKARPERSVAEGYLGDECITFCSRYLHRVETKFNQRDRNDDGGKSFGKGVLKEMGIELLEAAKFYVLQNCDECLPFVQEHKNILMHSGVRNVEESHRLQFSNWFHERIKQLYYDNKVDKKMLLLALGPERRVKYYPGYYMSGFRFHTLQCDENKKTQNCGVMVKGENQIDSVSWYGVLKDVVELRYTEGNRVVLFNCEWYDIVRKGTGYKIDRYGIISINTTRKLNTKEPFVLANQATQAFYVREIKNKAWSYVVETKPRNVYDMPNVDDDDEPYQEEEAHGGIQANQNDDEDDEIVG